MGFANSGKVSGVSFSSFDLNGSDLWTGGSFGLEGSLATTLVLCCALVVIFWRQDNMSSFLNFRAYLYNK